MFLTAAFMEAQLATAQPGLATISALTEQSFAMQPQSMQGDFIFCVRFNYALKVPSSCGTLSVFNAFSLTVVTSSMMDLVSTSEDVLFITSLEE